LTVGLKVTLIWQLAPAASVPPLLHVVPEAIAKSALIDIAEMINVVVPEFFSVTVSAALVVPTC
jgi:hypothetical protein